MTARRGKTQARRNQGNGGGLPGWAWGVIGLMIGVALILAAPSLLKSDGDGFFRPRPNPDAQPAPVAVDDGDVAAPDGDGTARGRAVKPAADKPAEYDFYTLLPGKEVALSDAELAATERAETRRAVQQAQSDTDTDSPTATATRPLPAPVAGDEPDASRATAAAPADKPAAAVAARGDDDVRYLLQAGAFQASGQAEELKARIALLGLGARVESASIGGKTIYRVRMGPYGTAGELAEAKRKLASGGLPGMAIKVQ